MGLGKDIDSRKRWETLEALRVFSGGDQVDGLLRAPSNALRGKAGPVQSKTIWANAGFFCDVLRIYLSELAKGQNLPSWDAKK